MFYRSQEPISATERKRVEVLRSIPLLSRLLGGGKVSRNGASDLLDVCRVSVEKCFIPADFNNEHPLYLLDLGDAALVLFGQWVFDPHSLIAPEEMFERWNCETAFFADFSLRYLAPEGKILQLVVEGDSLLEAERLPTVVRFKRLNECELLVGGGSSMIERLEKGGLIEPA